MPVVYKEIRSPSVLRQFYRVFIVEKGKEKLFTSLYRSLFKREPEMDDEWIRWCRAEYIRKMNQEKLIGRFRMLSVKCQSHRFYWPMNPLRKIDVNKRFRYSCEVYKRRAMACGMYEDIRREWLLMHEGAKNVWSGHQFYFYLKKCVDDMESFYEHDRFMFDLYSGIEKLRPVEEKEESGFSEQFWKDFKMTDGTRMCYVNYMKGLRRKQSRKAYKILMDIYKKYYGDRLVSTEARRRHSARRRNLKSAKKDSRVKTKILHINSGPTKCYWCSKKLPNGGHADHIVPLSKGGSHTCDNIVPSCSTCNETKKDTMPNSPELPAHMEFQLPLIHS